jgi:transcription elongation factor GreA
MRLPIRKPGKYTNLRPDFRITNEKFNDLKFRLEKLKNISRPRAAREVKELSTTGDYSENAGYQMAKGRLRGINQRILDMEEMIKNAVIIEHEENCSLVEIGHIVTIFVNGQEKKYKILGSSETNPGGGVISYNSAVGKALLGRRVGEVVNIQLNGKQIEYKIIKIE